MSGCPIELPTQEFAIYHVVFSVSFALAALLACHLAGLFDRRLAPAFAVLFAIYLGLDDLVTALGARFDIIGGDWNWSGKLYSLALSAVAMLALRLSIVWAIPCSSSCRCYEADGTSRSSCDRYEFGLPISRARGRPRSIVGGRDADRDWTD